MLASHTSHHNTPVTHSVITSPATPAGDVSMRTSYSAAPFRAEVPMLVSDLAHGIGVPRWSRRLDVSMRTSYSGARCQGRRLDVSMRTSSPRIPGSPHINTSHITHPHHTPRSTDHKSHTRHHKHITHLTPQHTGNTPGHSVTHPVVRRHARSSGNKPVAPDPSLTRR